MLMTKVKEETILATALVSLLPESEVEVGDLTVDFVDFANLIMTARRARRSAVR